MNILFYDFRNAESKYFEENPQSDFDIKFIKTPLNESTEISEHDANETCIISVFTTSRITEKVLDKFKNLRLITTRSTGFDHIDIEECAKRNIRVVNVEQYGKTSISEYTIGMIIMLVRNIVPAVRDMKRMEVNIPKYTGRDLCNLKLGIIGTGAIGASLCKIAHSLGMEILAHDIIKNHEIENIVSYVDLSTLLKNSDIVSLHIPYNKENYHIISSQEISIMKEGSFLINTARGELIDTVALYDAIETKKLGGCALDVQECESLVINMRKDPLKIDNSDNNCLQKAMIIQKLAALDNVIITPHIAYNTTDAINTILAITFSNIRDYLKGLNTNRIV